MPAYDNPQNYDGGGAQGNSYDGGETIVEIIIDWIRRARRRRCRS